MRYTEKQDTKITLYGVQGFLFGSCLLILFSIIQKIIAGFNPLVLKGYIVPFLFGGIAGSALLIYHKRSASLKNDISLLNRDISAGIDEIEKLFEIPLEEQHFDAFKAEKKQADNTGHKLIRNLRELTSRLSQNLSLQNQQLLEARSEIKILQGIIPLCCSCKEIHDDKWLRSNLEKYVSEHPEANFSHSYCEDCLRKLYLEQGRDKV